MKKTLSKVLSFVLIVIMTVSSVQLAPVAADVVSSEVIKSDAVTTNNETTSADNTEYIETANDLAGEVMARFENNDWEKFLVSNKNMSLKYTLSAYNPWHVDYINNSKGASYITNTMEAFVKMTDGTEVTEKNYSKRAIANMFRHGYYYDEVRLEGSSFSDEFKVTNTYSMNITSPYAKVGASLTKQNDGSVLLQTSGSGTNGRYIEFSRSLSLNAADYNYVYVTLKTTSVKSSAVYLIAGDQTTFTANQYVAFDICDDGEYRTYKINLTNISGYEGTIKGFRLNVGGEIYVKSVEFVKAEHQGINNLYLNNIFHTYSDKLHYEMQVAVAQTLTGISEVGVKTEIDASTVSNIIIADKTTEHTTINNDIDWDSVTYVGFDIASAGVFGLILPVDETTGKLNVTLENNKYVITYSRTPKNNRIEAGSGSTANNIPGVGNVNDFYMGYRIHTDETHTFEELKKQAYIERNPLTAENIIINNETSDGATFLGYDGLRGSYMFDMAYNLDNMFEYYKNKHFTLNFTVKSDEYKRTAYFVAGTEQSVLECAAILDENLMMLPIPIEVGKNFFGDKDENIFDLLDIGYGEAILPIIADPDVAREYSILHIYENWGDYQHKQISFIEFHSPYYHLSTGTVETNCLVPWGWTSNRAIPSMMPDHRGMSGTEWPGSRTHTAAGSHSFLKYNTSSYEDLTDQSIDSYGPTYVDYSMELLSADGKIKTTRRHLEFPDLDENRTFYMFTYEALENVTISDVKSSFSFYSVGSNSGSVKYQQYGYLNSSNTSITDTFANTTDKAVITLGSDKPYFSVFQRSDVDYANVAFLVDSFTIVDSNGNTKSSIPSLAIRISSSGSVALTLNTTSLALNKGDKIILNAMLLPWGSEQTDYTSAAPDQNVRDVREYTLLNPVDIAAVANCEVTEELFMYKLTTTNQTSAEFTVSGGKKNTTVIPYREGNRTIAIRVDGFSKLSVPIVYEKINGEWVQVKISSADNLDDCGFGAQYDGYSVYYNEDGTYSYAFIIDAPEGTERTFKVELDNNFKGFERIVGDFGRIPAKPALNLHYEGNEFGTHFTKNQFGRFTSTEGDDGITYCSLYPHHGHLSSEEHMCYIYEDASAKLVTGQYLALRYRIPEASASKEEMGFQFFTATENDSAVWTDHFVLDPIIKDNIDGEWHIIILDLASWNKSTIKPDENGEYRLKYVRFDPLNFIDPDKQFEHHVDISHFSLHDDISDLYDYYSKIEGDITLVSNDIEYTLDTKLGDANGDGKITNLDLLAVFKYIYNRVQYPLGDNLDKADVNGDGSITMNDVRMLLKYLYNPAANSFNWAH